MNRNKLVVFDLDGTINRTELYAVPAHQKALAMFGENDVSGEFIISTFGAPWQEYTQTLLPGRPVEERLKYLDLVREYEKEFIKLYKAAYKGMPNTLQTLKQKGYQTAVCSNSSVRYMTLVLTELGLFNLIDRLRPLEKEKSKCDTLRLLLNEVKPDKAVMAGDRYYDKEAARENGIPFIGCGYGFKPDEVKDADIYVTSAGQIAEAVGRLIG